MVVDYNALRTWKTPDLLFRDSRLQNRTRVMGMSETAAIIHIVALVCTAGVSLPINLAFCIWHGHRYGKVKKERTWIRQILGTRNMAYQGRGQWLQVQPTQNKGQKVRVTPTRHANNDFQMQFAQANANAAANDWQQDFGNNADYDLQVQFAQANGNAAVNDWEQDFGNNADNDLQVQFAQAIANSTVNDWQQDFGNNDASCEDIVPGLLDLLAS